MLTGKILNPLPAPGGSSISPRAEAEILVKLEACVTNILLLQSYLLSGFQIYSVGTDFCLQLIRETSPGFVNAGLHMTVYKLNN